MKFKSLTMRIWITNSALILAIILGITFFYVFAYHNLDMKGKTDDLIVAHDTILSSGLNEPHHLNQLQNLQHSGHFIVRNNKVVMLGMGMGMGKGQGQGQGFGAGKMSDKEIQNYLAQFATGDLTKKQIKENYKGTEYLAVISKTDNGYLVSYMPTLYDNKLVYMMLLAGVIFILAGFIVARVLARYISKPLLDIEAFTKKIAMKKWSEPINVNSKDEIGNLANSMNKMQEDLKRADQEEKIFLQSISHDLKTPIMVIMSHADALIDGIYVENPENTAKIIKDEAINLNKKVKQLLYFNTLLYSLENQSEEEEIDLSELIEHTVMRFKPLRTNIDWEINIEKKVFKADYEKFTIAIENILDNALRYAKTKIEITLKDGVIEIFNDGSHIENENLTKIFDHMYKSKTGNFGLGLAISKKIIDFYKGTLVAKNRENGVSFIIKLTNGGL